MWTCGHNKTMVYFMMIKNSSPEISVPKFQFWKKYFQRKDCGHIHLGVSLRNIFQLRLQTDFECGSSRYSALTMKGLRTRFSWLSSVMMRNTDTTASPSQAVDMQSSLDILCILLTLQYEASSKLRYLALQWTNWI